MAIPDPDYRTRLCRSVFFAQLMHPQTPERLRRGIGGGLIACLRAMGGVLYIVIGDSHASHYQRDASCGPGWLAPLPVMCHGATAAGLMNGSDRTLRGQAILQ